MAATDVAGVRHRVRYEPAWDPRNGGSYGWTVCRVMFVFYDDKPPGVEKMRITEGPYTCLACVRKDIPCLPYE